MRIIGTVATLEDAETLSAWMTAEGLENHVDQVDSKFELWIKDEDQVPAARQALEAYLANPRDAKYREAKGRVALIEREKILAQRRYQQNIQTLGNVRSQQAKTPLVFTLLGICVLVALFTSFGEKKDTIWFRSLAFTHLEPEVVNRVKESERETEQSLKFWSIRRGEVWRMVTPIFIHFGTVHLIFNMLWLVQLGRAIEQRFGSWWLLALVISAAIVGNTFEVWIPSAWGGMRVGIDQGHGLLALGGMSGVVYALFGFIWVRSVIDPRNQFNITTGTVVIMLGWLVFCALPMSESVLGFKVANWAHGLGLAVGIAGAYLGYWVQESRRKSI
jgi:GlpG protein